MKQLRGLLVLFALLLGLCLAVIYVPAILNRKPPTSAEDRKAGLDMVEKNYGHVIDSVARVLEIPAPYLKALCMLECGGRKAFSQRFEPHVYDRLKCVKFGALDNYEHVTPTILTDANDEALRNLASSWGPFQLMGYKCLLLDIKVRDIRGDFAVLHGARWIKMTYGEYLDKKKYRDAFHIHNTGSPYPVMGKPRTYDPDYCTRGLKYMAYFERN